ncbi:MAG: PorT family protein [Cyclobacteriaceae bacterium]|nr:PorT family protein [Cyclobacteriaceae bacterium]
MKRLYFLAACWVIGITPAFSQASNCTQVLRLIRTTYEQGRLHEVPGLAEGCLKGQGTQAFTKEEKKEAYRYLTLSYIYLEEPEKADEMMVQLLNTDHFYEPNKEVDPAEFIALYNKFRHDPLYRLGVKFGLNLTQPVVTNYYNVGSAGAGQGGYSMSPSFQVYGFFEKDFFRNAPWKNLVLAAEVGYVSRGYTYTNDQLATADEDPSLAISNQEFQFSHQYLDLNVIAQYKLKSTIKLQTYVGGGPGISYLLSSSNQASTVLGNGFTVTGTAVDDKDSYNPLLFSLNLVAGAKVKFGEVYLTAEGRYQMGFTNMVNQSSRTNQEIAFDYQGRYNDYRVNTMLVSIGIIYPHFKPLKLIR